MHHVEKEEVDYFDFARIETVVYSIYSFQYLLLKSILNAEIVDDEARPLGSKVYSEVYGDDHKFHSRF